MNKLLATLVAGTFAVVASSAFAQGTTPPATPSAAEKAKENLQKAQSTDKAKAFAENEKAAQDLSRNSPNPNEQKANVEKSKMDPKMKGKYDEGAAQRLSTTSTNPGEAKANVAASKEQSAKREKMPNLSKLTKEQKQELYRQLQKENTGG